MASSLPLLSSHLIFSLFFVFSASLPIFMPVPLRQYRFRQTLALHFHPFFLPIQGFPTLSSSLSPFLTKHFGILTVLLILSPSAFVMHSGNKKGSAEGTLCDLILLTFKKTNYSNHQNVKMEGSGACVKPIYYLTAFLIYFVPEKTLYSMLAAASKHFYSGTIKAEINHNVMNI